MNKNAKSVLVTGASGLLGIQLVTQLAKSNYQVTAIGRRECPAEIKSFCSWQQIDLAEDVLTNLNTEIMIHAAPLWLLPEYLRKNLANSVLQRCIAFSSTSAESKTESVDREDRELAKKLLSAESEIKTICENAINYTLFRPTMIYGYGKDENISAIARFITKYRFFPVAGKASGLRQPVHVDDLVKATTNVINNENTYSKTYNLTGGETLDYHSMVARIFKALNIPARIITLPVFIYRFLLTLKNYGYSRGVADRMNQNLAYNCDLAVQDFAYQAQVFMSEPKRDLP